MNRQTFVEAAAHRGIEPASASALYHDLYGVDVAQLSASPVSFVEENRLARTVEVFVWIGTVAVIGALVWQAGFLVAAEWARRRRFAMLETGFAAIVVFYTPLAVYSLERVFGVRFRTHDFHDFYPWISGGWVFMEIAAIAAAAAALVRYRRPFLMLPLTLFSGFLAMDGATRALGGW